MTNSIDFINFLIKKFKYNTYLEIGVSEEPTLGQIECGFKIGIDPNRDTCANIYVSSDDFFSICNQKFDIIFLNKTYSDEQVYKDINNSLTILSPGGTIICRNMWTGGCDEYKGLLRVISGRRDLITHVLTDFESGTAIIRKTVENEYWMKHVENIDIDMEEWHKKAIEWNMTMSLQEYLNTSDEIVICAIAKQELDYIKDWCEWHLNIGFDKIYIYDNNDIDSEENYNWLENLYPGRIEIRNVRGKKAQQILQYQSFCDDNIFKWVAYIDIDEYIVFSKDEYFDIKQFLGSFPDIDSFIIRWRCFRANPDISPIDKPIYEYCNIPIPDNIRRDTRPERVNGWYKSITRSGFMLKMNEHKVWSDTGKTIRYKECSLDIIRVNHYIIKNIEEFFYKKYRRGHAGIDAKEMEGYTWWYWNQNLNYFSDLQGPLSDKEQIFLFSKGYKPNWTFRPRINLLVHVEPSELEWYGALKIKSVENIMSCTDSNILTLVDTSSDKNCWDMYYNVLNFCSNDWWHPEWGCAYIKEFERYETYGQPEIFLNLGYDVDIIGKESESQKISDTLANNFDTGLVKNSIKEIIDNPDTFIIYSSDVEYDDNCAGYREVVSEFLSNYNLEPLGFRVKNNNFITSGENYKRMYDGWLKFMSTYGSISEKGVIENHMSGITTIYDAWQFAYPCLVQGLKII